MTIGDARRAVAAFMERAFVPREVFFRSGDRFHHLRVSVRAQKIAAGLGSLAVLWAVFASISFGVQSALLLSRHAEIERQELAYFDLLAEVSEYHDQFAQITRDLEDNQALLLSVLEQGGEGDQRLAQVEDRLKTSASEHARVVIARDGLRDKMERFETSLLDIADRNSSLKSQVAEMRSLLNSSRAERDEVAEARVHLTNEVADLQARLGAALAEQATLEDRVAGLTASLAKAAEQETALQDQRDGLARRVEGLEQRLVHLRDAEQGVIDGLNKRASLTIGAIEKTVEMTGLDVNALIASVEDEALGQGGPFVPLDYMAADEMPGAEFEQAVSMLDKQLDRWTALQEILRRIPLAAPLDQYRISSGFGTRRDPINGRKARHMGVDFAAPHRSSVYATAPGKVVYAGWRGRFGRTVEIDHGYGLRTRYSHLRKILVEAGQEVGHREKIGLVGSSGRSTGPHVHYEVRYLGKARNPMKFLKAGKHVFKG